jgi:hypothetical protein
LYVSNSSTSKTDGYRCYHHKGPGLPTAHQSVNCNHLGKYVIIYNERKSTATYPATWYTELAILELCKVRIHGKYNYISVVFKCGIYVTTCIFRELPENWQETKNSKVFLSNANVRENRDAYQTLTIQKQLWTQDRERRQNNKHNIIQKN